MNSLGKQAVSTGSFKQPVEIALLFLVVCYFLVYVFFNPFTAVYNACNMPGKNTATVYSRYLEFQGTGQNMSSYQLFEVTKS